MPIYKVPPPAYPPAKFFPLQPNALLPPPTALADKLARNVPPAVKPKPTYRPTQQPKFFQWPPPPANVEIKGSISPGRRHSVASTRCCPYKKPISPTSPFGPPTPPPPLYPAEPGSPGRTSEVRRPPEPSPGFSPTQLTKSLHASPDLPSYETDSSISPPRRHSTSSTTSSEQWSPALSFELPLPTPPGFSPTQQPKSLQGSPSPPSYEINSSISPPRRHSTSSTIYNEALSPTLPYDLRTSPPAGFSPTQQPKPFQDSPDSQYYEVISPISPPRRHSTSSAISPASRHSTSPIVYQDPWSPTLPFELPIPPPSEYPLAPGLLQKTSPLKLDDTVTSASNVDFSDTKNLFAKPGPSDAFVRSKNVVGLISKTFKSFLHDVDASFVLFYNPCDDKCKLARSSIREAAEITKRPNHVYAAVDCTKECELCQKQHVTTLPTMKLFARGITVNTFGENTFLNAQDMKQFVENSPAVNTRPTRRQTCRVQ